MRKLARDGTSWTPTEKLKRDGLLRQFSTRAKGYAVAISEAFREGYEGLFHKDDCACDLCEHEREVRAMWGSK